jgi:hypothetical protein
MADDPREVWPIDKIGNQIRTGRVIVLKLEEAEAMFFVDKVTPAKFLLQGNGDPIPVAGEIELVLRMKLPYAPDRRVMGRAVVTERPDPEKVS